MTTYDRPGDILNTQDNFQNNEVGVTHPSNPSFVKLNDNGDVEIFASEGVGIHIDRNSRSIILIADAIKFLTKEDEGLRWNRLSFNKNAVFYQEPTFLEMSDEDMYCIYKGVNQYVFGGGTVINGVG